jgi:hypothetical protein
VRAVRSWQAARLLPGGDETGGHPVRVFIPLEGIPAAGLERPDTARANRPRDVPERCADPLLWHTVDRRKVPNIKLATSSMRASDRSGSSTLPMLISRFVMAFLTLAAQSVGIARPPFRELTARIWPALSWVWHRRSPIRWVFGAVP